MMRSSVRCLHRGKPSNASAGLYIASHPWLPKVDNKTLLVVPPPSSTTSTSVTTTSGKKSATTTTTANSNKEKEADSVVPVYKVGFSRDLGRRLLDGTYTTCFTDEWQFKATLEVDKAKDAAALEAGVLYCTERQRLQNGAKELVAMEESQLITLSKRVAKVMGIDVTVKMQPTYQAPPTSSTTSFGNDSEVNSGDVSLVKKFKGELDELRGYTPIGTSTAAAATATSSSSTDAKAANVMEDTSSKQQKKKKGKTNGGEDDDEEDVTLGEILDIDTAKVEEHLLESEVRGIEPITLRPYQQIAHDRTLRELAVNGKTVLQMACRTGKTPVAFKIMENYMDAESSQNMNSNGKKQKKKDAPHQISSTAGAALYLVPGLALLRQTVHKLLHYGYGDRILLIGSDPTPIYGPSKTKTGKINIEKLDKFFMTTDPTEIKNFLTSSVSGCSGPKLVISTYQSSTLVPMTLGDLHRGPQDADTGYSAASYAANPLSSTSDSTAEKDNSTKKKTKGEKKTRDVDGNTSLFDLVVFDECHRVCGNAEASTFNNILIRTKENGVPLVLEGGGKSPRRRKSSSTSGTAVAEAVAGSQERSSKRKKRTYGAIIPAEQSGTPQSTHSALRAVDESKLPMEKVLELIQNRRLPPPAVPKKKSKKSGKNKQVVAVPPSPPMLPHRLFMTATPAYDLAIPMHNKSLFGGIAFRYYLRTGIDAGHCNPFKLRIIAGEAGEGMIHHLLESMKLVNKMLVFCRSIRQAEELCRKLAEVSPLPEGVEPFQTLVAHCNMPHGGVAKALRVFSAKGRMVMFNCRLFQEGVEIPRLEAVFFAAPRYSPRDIIQSICRPLQRFKGKSISYVFIPTFVDSKLAPEHPVNLQHFSTLVPFTDALMEEDPKLFEYLIDPSVNKYDVDVMGTRELQLNAHGALRTVYLSAIRRAMRYTLTGTDRLKSPWKQPWELGFNEMKRVVLECGRYPKTNDAWVIGDSHVALHRFFTYCRQGYDMYLRGDDNCHLEPHQLRDLESLPHWRRYGMGGPYRWEECVETLRQYLKKTKGKKIPPLEIHKGGWVGLDATPFERLSGALCVVNQHDTTYYCSVSDHKQEQLRTLEKEFKVKLLKERNKKTGELVKNQSMTFIQQSFEDFKTWEKKGAPDFHTYVAQHYPGYPLKHHRQEHLHVLRDGLAPPRLTTLSEEKVNKKKNATGKDEEETSAAITTKSKKKKSGSPTETDELLASTAHRRLGNMTVLGSGGNSAATSDDDATMTTAVVRNLVFCRACRVHLDSKDWKEHLKSPIHLKNCGSDSSAAMTLPKTKEDVVKSRKQVVTKSDNSGGGDVPLKQKLKKQRKA